MERTFDTTFKHFSRLVIDMHIQWQMFRDLHENIDHYPIFDSTAPNFFIHLRSYLYDLIFLSISRFFDPAIKGKQENLCLSHIISFNEVASIYTELEKERAHLEDLWQSGIRIWRHKTVSHNDLPTIFDSKHLPDIPNKDIESLVNGISDFARKIECHVYERDQSYEVHIQGWVPQLIRYLKLGIQKKAEQGAAANP